MIWCFIFTIISTWCNLCEIYYRITCFQGRKLSRNWLCTVGLTLTSGDVTGTGVGIVTALAFPLIMQCRYAMCFRGIFSSEYRKDALWLARKGEVRGVFCGFIIWSVFWLSHFVLFSMSRYIQRIRAIFDRDIMRAYGNYISEMICHILVVLWCQQISV